MQALYECHTIPTGLTVAHAVAPSVRFSPVHVKHTLQVCRDLQLSHSQADFQGTFVALRTQPPISSPCFKPKYFN